VKMLNDECKPGRRMPANLLARQYAINEKTIRDIWEGRTWHQETLALDPSREGKPRQLRAPGRPRGSGGAHGPGAKPSHHRVLGNEDTKNHSVGKGCRDSGFPALETERPPALAGVCPDGFADRQPARRARAADPAAGEAPPAQQRPKPPARAAAAAAAAAPPRFDSPSLSTPRAGGVPRFGPVAADAGAGWSGPRPGDAGPPFLRAWMGERGIDPAQRPPAGVATPPPAAAAAAAAALWGRGDGAVRAVRLPPPHPPAGLSPGRRAGPEVARPGGGDPAQPPLRPRPPPGPARPGASLPAAAPEPLPGSSRAEDPFHDDWAHW
jgi:hypothetical protein